MTTTVRIAPDGNAYTQKEFIEFFGDDHIWNNALLKSKIQDNIMKVGKYKGYTFSDIAIRDASYCGWVLSTNPTTGSMLDFRDYLVRKLAS